MSRQVHNVHPSQILWLSRRCGISAAAAMGALNFYGFCEHIAEHGGKICIKSYASGSGLSRTSIHKASSLLREFGFITADLLPNGIPFEEPVETPAPKPKPTPAPTPAPTPKVEKPKGPTLQEQVVAAWNEHKPASWVELSSLGKSRQKSIEALGGYREVLKLIPAFMAGAKANKFWRDKAISFEQVIGKGATPKPHFNELAERGAGSNLDSKPAPGRLEHPEFFRPTESGLMIAKPGVRFSSKEDKREREAIAREFYQSQN